MSVRGQRRDPEAREARRSVDMEKWRWAQKNPREERMTNSGLVHTMKL